MHANAYRSRVAVSIVLALVLLPIGGGTGATPMTEIRVRGTYALDGGTAVADQGEVPHVLRHWAAALSQRESSPAVILAVGDSITEGYFATGLESRWLNLVQARLRQAFPTAGREDGGFGYRAGAYSFPGFASATREGAVAEVTTRGLGHRALSIGNRGSVTFSAVVGTTIRVNYSTIADGSPLSVSVDGGPPLAVATHRPGQQMYLDDWTDIAMGGPVRRSHTVTFSRGTGGRLPPQLGGMQIFDGDEARGIHVLDAGHSSWRASDFAAGARGASADHSDIADWVPDTGADLALVALGTNDWRQSVDPEAYERDLQVIITNLRDEHPRLPVLLIAWNEPPRRFAGAVDYQDYVAAMRRRARANADVALIDLSAEPVVPTAFGLHPDDRGNAVIAEHLLPLLAAGVGPPRTPPE